MTEEKRTRELLEEEIKDVFLKIHYMDLDDPKRTAAISDLKMLSEMQITEWKMKEEISQRKYQYKSVLEQKEKELLEMKKDRWFRFATSMITLGAEMTFFGLFTYVGFKFEENGSLTSKVFKEFIGRFRFRR